MTIAELLGNNDLNVDISAAVLKVKGYWLKHVDRANEMSNMEKMIVNYQISIATVIIDIEERKQKIEAIEKIVSTLNDERVF
jgi:hypothetical protein